MLLCLVVAMGVDYLTGLIKAVVKKKLKSTVSVNGLLKKTAIVLFLSAIYCFSYFMNLPEIFNAVCVFYIINEIISVCENLKAIGVKTPDTEEMFKEL